MRCFNFDEIQEVFSMHISEETLREMTEKIVREVGPRKVILFGSHAYGTMELPARTLTLIFWWLKMARLMPAAVAALK